ncbi:hypothetical protein B0H10DRAFT_2034577 [Mycena sp. CBHHK59/15]|nr:hypothetical protein B0H10DRAFT_2034577 [Mycena sp. CBHHK59/15]
MTAAHAKSASCSTMTTTRSDTSSTVVSGVAPYKGYGKQRSALSSTHKSSMEAQPIIYIPKRQDLNRVVGPDVVAPTTEISTIPCAGVRISHGPMAGLMAWRFVVEREGPRPKSSVVTNFVLDTGNKNSIVPLETLRALGYRGDLNPGAEVTLLLQGVKTKCIVGNPGEAGRLGVSFMSAGSLTYYFDSSRIVPIFYDGSLERPDDVPRTIWTENIPRRPWFVVLKEKILSLMKFSGS